MRRVGFLLVVTAWLTLGATCGYQANTLPLPRDEAMVAIGKAHQACKDGKLPKTVCTQIDALVASVATQKSADPAMLIGLIGQLLPLIGGF